MLNCTISFPEVNGKNSVNIEAAGFRAKSLFPVELQVLHGRHLTAKYKKIEKM